VNGGSGVTLEPAAVAALAAVAGLVGLLVGSFLNVVVAALLGVAAAGQGEYRPLLRAALGGAALWAFYFLLHVIKPQGMGYGDVKLAGVLGMYLGWLGWGQVALGTFLGFAIGGVVSIGLLVAGRAGRKTQIPFGPYMIAGAWLGLTVGGDVWDWYLSLSGYR